MVTGLVKNKIKKDRKEDEEDMGNVDSEHDRKSEL
jgi:hypothetical protein